MAKAPICIFIQHHLEPFPSHRLYCSVAKELSIPLWLEVMIIQFNPFILETVQGILHEKSTSSIYQELSILYCYRDLRFDGWMQKGSKCYCMEKQIEPFCIHPSFCTWSSYISTTNQADLCTLYIVDSFSVLSSI